jgi:Sulfotransferase domain
VALVRLGIGALIPESTKNWIRERQYQRKLCARFRAQLRPTDTFLVGHPKSGNTWITYMLTALVEKHFGKRATLANLQEYVPAVHASDLKIEAYSQLPNPRMFRNEGPKFPELYPRTIYIIRDPRAVLLSYYHHCLHDTRNPNWELDDFIDEMLEHGCIKRLEPYIIRWDKQVSNWLRRAKKQPVQIVRYEDMKRDRRAVLQEVVRFTGISCTEQDIAQAVERSSFEHMRKEEETYGAEPYSGTKGEGGFFMRRGKVDSWKEELSAYAKKRIETEFGETMRKLEYLP